MVTGLKEFIGNPELSAHIHTYITDTCICTWVIWNLPKNRGRKLNYPKQQKQQQQQRDGYRSENKTIKGTQKRENKSWEKHSNKKKRNACKVKWKSASPKGISSWLLFLLLYLPCPAPCHINHISHATLCPLMSMPDICHGPWPMSYYLHNNPPSPIPSLKEQYKASLYLSFSPFLPAHTLCCLSQRRSCQTKIKLVYFLFGATSTGRGFRQHMFEYFMRNTRQILPRDVHNVYKWAI